MKFRLFLYTGLASKPAMDPHKGVEAGKMYIVFAICRGTKVIMRLLKKKLRYQKKNWDTTEKKRY